MAEPAAEAADLVPLPDYFGAFATKLLRAEGDAEFAKFLLEIGEGAWRAPPDTPAPETSMFPATVLLPPQICAPPTSSAEELLNWVYEGLPGDPEQQLDFYAAHHII